MKRNYHNIDIYISISMPDIDIDIDICLVGWLLDGCTIDILVYL